MKTAFCFAGQGSQFVGQGKDFYENSEIARRIFDMFPSVRDLCFFDTEKKLDLTAYSQPAILLTSYVIAKLAEQTVKPDYCCGLSLGEYTALGFSGVWELGDTMDIISARGAIMQDALPIGTTGMVAIIGLPRDAVREAAERASAETGGVCEVANYNCPGQIVVTGENKAIERAAELAKAAGAKLTVPLNVSGAFHSSLLKDASDKLRAVLDRYTPNSPKYEIVYNVSGRPESGNINDLLQKQIKSSVYFEDSIRYMIENGVDTFVEIGPGKALSGFIRKTDRSVKVYTISDYVAYSSLCSELGNK